MSNTPVYLRDRHWDASSVIDSALNKTQDAINARVMNAVGSDNAAAHNAAYRGKNIGTSVTAAQYAAIDAGTFDDLYIGDYWTIDGVNWRIAAFDYWLNTSYPTICETHHVVIVPDTALYSAQMHNTEGNEYVPGYENNPITGAYVGSDMYTSNLAQAKTQINSAFGAAHILNHKSWLKNAVTDACESGASWYDSTVELMTEQMVYGSRFFGNVKAVDKNAILGTIDKTQLPLFALNPSAMNVHVPTHKSFWLRDVAYEASFCVAGAEGKPATAASTNSTGVRPVFGICAEQEETT